MKKLLLITGCILSIFTLYAQESSKIKTLVDEGIVLNDAGKYQEALAKYSEALSIDKNSTRASYEMAYTYYDMQSFAKTIELCNKVIGLDKKFGESVFILLGNAYDMLGNSDEAIQTYKDGISVVVESNLLYYNLALTLLNTNKLDEAEPIIEKSITMNPKHTGSHVVLAALMEKRGQRVKTILPLYYSLLLEPDTRRSVNLYTTLKKKLQDGAVKKDRKTINISLTSAGLNDSNFVTAELALGLMAAARYTTDSTKSEIDYFIETTKSIFSTLGELKKDNKGLFWDLYVRRFNDLVKLDGCAAFCYYISATDSSINAEKWFSENPGKQQEFVSWRDAE